MHGAGAALRDAAAEFRAGEPRDIAETQSSGVSGSTSTLCSAPLSVKLIIPASLAWCVQCADRPSGLASRQLGEAMHGDMF